MELLAHNRSNYFPLTFNNWLEQVFETDRNDHSVSYFRPPTDVLEKENFFEIHLHAPGMKKEDFKIEFNNQHLVISGERKQEYKESQEDFHIVESTYGSFRRSFRLPEYIDGENIKAAYKEGILQLTLPKDEKKVIKTNQIEVK